MSAHRTPVLTLDALIGWSLVAAVCLWLAYATGTLHWALVPLGLSGAMLAPTVVRWLRGRSDAFDPKAIVSLFMLHNTFVAPVLHLAWDWYTPLVRVPDDAWTWFGRLACVNAVALACLELAYRRTVATRPRLRPLVRVRPERLAFALGIGGLVAVAAQVQLLRHFGGPSGLIAAYEIRSDQFSGVGMLLMLAWPFPLIALLETLIVLSKRPARRLRPGRARASHQVHVARASSVRQIGPNGAPSDAGEHSTLRAFRSEARVRPEMTCDWRSQQGPGEKRGRVLGLLVAFAILHLGWAGLHGSRLSMLGGMFLAAGLCHFLLRRFSHRAVMIGMSAAFVFCFVYSFYKGAGRDGITTALSGTSGLAQAQQQTGRDVGWLLLGDLARADVQMEVLWTMYDANPDYRPKRGATYVGAALFIPRSVWPTRPRGPQEAYAELRDGLIGARAGDVPNSRVFGLTGETLLNFGWAGVPVLHALFGIVIGLVRRATDALRPGDARFLLVPFATLLVTALYLLDLSQVVFMFLQDCALLGTCAAFAFWRPQRRSRPFALGMRTA